MKAPKTFIVPLALFVLAFVGVLLAQRLTAPAIPKAAKPMAAAPVLRVASSASLPAAASAPAVDEPPPAQSPSSVRPTPPAIPASAPVVEEEPAPLLAPSAIETVDQAVEALKHSGNVDDRVRAVRFLADAARDGKENSRVRATLMYGAADANPDVAARAQEELDALVEREDR